MQTWAKPIEVRRKPADAALWGRWTLGSAAAGLLTGAGVVAFCGDKGYLLIGFLLAPVLGAFQLVVLRPYTPTLAPGVWLLLTTIAGIVGWGLGFWVLGSLLVPLVYQEGWGDTLPGLLAALVFTLSSGAILGLGFGVAQRNVIEETSDPGPGRADPARVWLASNAGAWAVALLGFLPVILPLFGSDSIFPMPGWLIVLCWTLSTTLAGALTGLALYRLLQPAATNHPQG